MFGTPTPTRGLGCWSKAKEGQGLSTHQWGALWPAGAQCLLLHAGAQGLGLRVEAGGRGMCFSENILWKLWPYNPSLLVPPQLHRPPSH